MLTEEQIEKLELSQRWIKDVALSSESFDSSFNLNRNLVKATSLIDMVLDEQKPCDYPRRKRPNRLLELALDASVRILALSGAVFAALCLGAVFCYGLDRVEQSKGDDYQTVWVKQARVFEGLAICTGSVGIAAGVVGVCTSRGDFDG